MDSVMDFVNISFIYHAIQNGQLSHYPMINDLKRKNVRDVRDKKRKKLFPLLLFVSGSAFIPLQSSHLFVPLHHSFKNT